LIGGKEATGHEAETKFQKKTQQQPTKAKRGSEQYQPTNSSALYAYSSYQHVTDGTAYPAVLFLTGANDPRVNPANSRKMTARLQAATNPKRLVFSRTSSTTGHGIDSSLDEQVEAGADV